MKVLEPDLKAPVISEQKNFKIVALSDFHIGGAYGYLPKGCLDRRGKEIMQDEHQEIKEKNLIDALKKIGKVDLLILLGDMVEGQMKKSGGLDVLDVNMDLQIQWASDNALSPIVKILEPDIVIGCTGSEYHVGCHNDLLVTERLNNLFPEIKRL